MKLNAIQEVMASHDQGPCLVFAVAGSGKTTGIVERISRMYQRGIDPRTILATTFNKDAAEEIKKRLRPLFGGIVNLAPIQTSHSMCYNILQSSGENITMIKEQKAKDCIKKKIRAMNGKVQPGEDADILNYIGFLKNHLAWYEDIPGMPFATNLSDGLRRLEYLQGADPELISECFSHYEKHKQENGLWDFDDMLLQTYWLLSTNERILKYYQNRFQYIMVDEYQDTNKAQYEIFKMLSAEHRNFMAVGDDDQSIYSFRGSDPSYIQILKRDYPDIKVVTLAQNYRSQSGIVVTANELIKINKNREPKSIEANIPFERKPVYVECPDARSEAKMIAESIHLSCYKPTEIAILTRTNAQQCFIEDAMIERQIPYYVVRSVPFFKRKEIQAIISYLKIAASTEEEGEIMDEIRSMANKPYRKIGKDEIARWTTMKSILLLPQGYQYHDNIQYLRSLYKNSTKNMAMVVESIINYPINLSFWVKQDGQVSDDNNAKKNMDQFQELCHGKTFEEVMDKIARSEIEYAKMKDKKDGVALSTIHSCKGLEWDEVYVAGCNQGVLPSKSNPDLEEERRLAYVAITRAREFLVLSSYQDNGKFARSQFIEEISGLLDHDSVEGEPTHGDSSDNQPGNDDSTGERSVSGGTK